VANYNSGIIKEFRNNQGEVGGQFEHLKLLLLTVKGAKTGILYTHPVAYTTDGDHLIVVASKGGADTNPAWYHNLVANPDVTVEVGAAAFKARATPATGAERERLFNQHAAQYPQFNDYKAKTKRQLPVVVLEKSSQ
jgi:deazaflavin-dependent oxidoreductase (nitroreductase family)